MSADHTSRAGGWPGLQQFTVSPGTPAAPSEAPRLSGVTPKLGINPGNWRGDNPLASRWPGGARGPALTPCTGSQQVASTTSGIPVRFNHKHGGPAHSTLVSRIHHPQQWPAHHGTDHSAAPSGPGHPEVRPPVWWWGRVPSPRHPSMAPLIGGMAQPGCSSNAHGHPFGVAVSPRALGLHSPGRLRKAMPEVGSDSHAGLSWPSSGSNPAHQALKEQLRATITRACERPGCDGSPMHQHGSHPRPGCAHGLPEADLERATASEALIPIQEGPLPMTSPLHWVTQQPKRGRCSPGS